MELDEIRDSLERVTGVLLVGPGLQPFPGARERARALDTLGQLHKRRAAVAARLHGGRVPLVG